MAKFTGNLALFTSRKEIKNNKNKEEKMKRTDYETLAMEEIIVEMENGFLEGSADVQNPNNDQGRINAHEVNTGFSADFGGTDDWDVPAQ